METGESARVEQVDRDEDGQVIKIRLDEQTLSQCLFQYYRDMRENSMTSSCSALVQNFSQTQEQLIEMVEMRKNMEKVIQLQAMQSQHFGTVQLLLSEKIKAEKTVNELSQVVKQLESVNIKQYVQHIQQKNSQTRKNEMVQNHAELTMMLNDLKREVVSKKIIQSHIESSQSLNFDDLEIKNWQFEEQFNHMFQEQEERLKLTKLIYNCKFRQLMLREELLEERQNALFQYYSSNHQLVDTLLRDKERDKNLRKKEREKFQEMIKARHQIDIDSEHLNHSERSLTSYYELELIKLKQKHKDLSETSQKEINRLKQITQTLQDQLRVHKQNLASNSNNNQELQEQINSIKLCLEVSNSEKSNTLSQLQEFKTKNGVLQREIVQLRSKGDKSHSENDDLTEKIESLQSQLNQAILKNSQNNQIKLELTAKLEKKKKTIEELQKNVKQLTQRLMEHQTQRNSLNLQIQELTQDRNNLRKAAEVDQNQIKKLQGKTAHLQQQLTQNFISNNHERNDLLFEISRKIQIIQDQQTQINSLSLQLKTQQEQVQNQENKLTAQSVQELKAEILIQLRRQSQARRGVIDEMVTQINSLLLQ